MAACLTDSLYPEVVKATVDLLEQLGHTAVFPQTQVYWGPGVLNRLKHTPRT